MCACACVCVCARVCVYLGLCYVQSVERDPAASFCLCVCSALSLDGAQFHARNIKVLKAKPPSKKT